MSAKILTFEPNPEARKSEVDNEAAKMAARITAADLEFHAPDFAAVERAYAKNRASGRRAIIRLIRDWYAMSYEDGRDDGTNGR